MAKNVLRLKKRDERSDKPNLHNIMTVVAAASWPKRKHAFHTEVNATLHGDKSL